MDGAIDGFQEYAVKDRILEEFGDPYVWVDPRPGVCNAHSAVVWDLDVAIDYVDEFGNGLAVYGIARPGADPVLVYPLE